MGKLPVPEPVKVTLVMVAVLLPGLFNWNWRTGTVTPGNWLELTGEFEPRLAETVTGVGVAVAVGVLVKVLVEVFAGLLVGVVVAVRVELLEGVAVKLLVGV